MAVPVDIFVKSDELVPVPIEGVVVVVIDPSAGFAPVDQVPTDAQGRAAFLLPGGTPSKMYEVRFFKLGFGFGGVKAIAVDEPALVPNIFDAKGLPYTMPVATDPRVCRCTGRFLSLGNQPIAGVMVRIAAKTESGFQAPKVVDANMIAAQAMHAKTNADGFVTVDLVRGGEFYVTFSGEDDVVWNIKVPDRASVNLIDLIHPQPVSLEWDSEAAPGNAVSLAVSEQVIVPMTMLFSDFEELEEGHSRWITLKSSDTTICAASLSGDRAAILGIAPGQATVTATLLEDILPSRIPPYGLAVTPLAITVT